MIVQDEEQVGLEQNLEEYHEKWIDKDDRVENWPPLLVMLS